MDQTARPDVYDTYTKDTFGADPADPAYHKQEAGVPGFASDELDDACPEASRSTTTCPSKATCDFARLFPRQS